MKKQIITLSCMLTALLIACTGSQNNGLNTSSVAQLTGFSLAAQDSFPGLAAAVFTIDERIDTGLVECVDSLLYGTRLDSVVPKFKFKATPGSARLTTPDTTFLLAGNDVVNLEKRPIYLTIKSSDATNTKVYEIVAYAHQADPDQWDWHEQCARIYDPDDSEMKALRLGGQWIVLKNNGFANQLYTSADAASWTNRGETSGLPKTCHVRSVVSDGETLYYAEAGQLYTTTDGIHWTNTDYNGGDWQLRNMLMCWNEHVWAIGEQEGKVVLLWMGEDGLLSPMGLTAGSTFPMSDFATVGFESSSERPHALVMGGYSEEGRALNTRWSIEYSPSIATNHGYRMIDLSIDWPRFDQLTGVSIVWYNQKLYMFGGADSEQQLRGNDILISESEGLLWTPADTIKNRLPATYLARQKQSALVLDNRIYLFGGQSEEGNKSDVYVGRLNSIDW